MSRARNIANADTTHAPLASPTFTGTTTSAGLRLSGGAIEQSDGTDLLTEGGALDNVALGSSVTAAANHGAVKTALNASGDAPIFACRAWVVFNGGGTPAIKASGNTSSISDNAEGLWTVNFTTAFPDVNYAVSGTVIGSSSGYGSHLIGGSGDANTTTTCKLKAQNHAGSAEDSSNISIMAIR